MAFIKLVGPDEATGLLKKIYDAAVKRAGRVFNILRVMSPNPPALRDSMFIWSSMLSAAGGRSFASLMGDGPEVSAPWELLLWLARDLGDLKASAFDELEARLKAARAAISEE